MTPGGKGSVGAKLVRLPLIPDQKGCHLLSLVSELQSVTYSNLTHIVKKVLMFYRLCLPYLDNRIPNCFAGGKRCINFRRA